MNIGILGCGLIGKKRGQQLLGHSLVGVFDPHFAKAQELATELNTRTFETEDDFFQNSKAEIVIIATTNNELARLTQKCIQNKMHVLVEKPAGITTKELEQTQRLAQEHNVAVKVGFNHRFHPAIFKAKQMIDANDVGELMFLRARYGHGARLGYEKEWRADPKISGGGELIDQGVHLLDLIFWFFGPLPLQSSFVTTSYWDMPVDDNSVITVANKKTWATFHVSCSEWKNTFSLEIYGRTGKLLISGLGRSYGKETLTYYKMLPEMGPPVTTTFDFPETDSSWESDLENLLDHLKNGTPLLGELNSAHYALSVVEKAAEMNGKN